MASKFEIQFETPPELTKLLNGLDGELVIKAVDAGMRAAGNVFLSKLKDVAPDGQANGTSTKQSAVAKGEKPNKKGLYFNSQPLRNKLALVVRKYSKSATAVIGARYPDGNEIFPLLAGHRAVLWGKQSKNVTYVKPHDDFMRQAFFAASPEAGKVALQKAGQFIERKMAKASATVARAS